MAKTTNKTVSKPRCGLCGKTRKLTKTFCCDHWICDDSDTYVMFSYARNSCWRNHDRYTLCAYHYHEGHTGTWQTCKTCRESFDIEDYVDMATNEYNFESSKPTELSADEMCGMREGDYSCSWRLQHCAQ